MATIDIQHLQEWRGRISTAEDCVTPRLVAEFEATFGALLAPRALGEAPFGLHWCLAPWLVSSEALGPDGHPARGGDLPPVPLPRRMWAGGEVEFLLPLCIGDVVTRRSTVGDVECKRGRSGTLVFITVRHEYETTRGIAISDRQDIVYREAAGSTRQPVAESRLLPGEPAMPITQVKFDSVFLFRYSALTFNGHRIHYDHPFATEVEGYEGLVVHGPLQATILLNATAAMFGHAPRSFSYRAQSPLIAGDTNAMEIRRDGNAIAAQLLSAAGIVTMCASSKSQWG